MQTLSKLSIKRCGFKAVSELLGHGPVWVGAVQASTAPQLERLCLKLISDERGLRISK